MAGPARMPMRWLSSKAPLTMRSAPRRVISIRGGSVETAPAACSLKAASVTSMAVGRSSRPSTSRRVTSSGLGASGNDEQLDLALAQFAVTVLADHQAGAAQQRVLAVRSDQGGRDAVDHARR